MAGESARRSNHSAPRKIEPFQITMATTGTHLTAEEYGRLSDNGRPTELVRGRIVEMNMPYFPHGKLCWRLGHLLGLFLDNHDVGHVVCNDAGVITERDPDTVRGPDISFYSYSRIPKGADPEGYPSVAPEVVFEVRSPNDRWPKILAKVSEYLDAGVTLVYIVDPADKTVTAFDADRPGRTLRGDDELEFPAPLAELRIAVRRLFS